MSTDLPGSGAAGADPTTPRADSPTPPPVGGSPQPAAVPAGGGAPAAPGPSAPAPPPGPAPTPPAPTAPGATPPGPFGPVPTAGITPPVAVAPADPAATAPITAAPVTGAVYPGASYPVTPSPYGPTPPSAPRRGPWVTVLSIVSAVLLLASGALGTLYYLQREEARRTSAEQQAQIAALRDEVAQLKEDLDDAQTRLRRAEDDLADAEACATAVQDFLNRALDIALSGESELPVADAERLVLEMMSACNVSV